MNPTGTKPARPAPPKKRDWSWRSQALRSLLYQVVALAVVVMIGQLDRAGRSWRWILGLLVLALALFGLVKGTGGRLLSLVCTFGIWAHAAGLACVLGYERLSSREVGVCDEGTGLPVALVMGAGLLVVAAEFLRGNR